MSKPIDKQTDYAQQNIDVTDIVIYINNLISDLHETASSLLSFTSDMHFFNN